ncbi:ABC transporter substrate-binding protein [Vreelandella andesensis]|uniref:ABC transporter substrate-binding protein n=1 Tax=Vreelandella andesensis TaxID=447567 RepID=A0A433KGJ9_9GAMM|nr:ProQ/FINO family protein [Halomonas andesensis]RUR27812.1 ABC transporter substrate-binding protein [Halomonas andesensis]
MAATVLALLETLETHLEQTKAELNALREENEMLKRQLADQAQNPQPSSPPIQNPVQPEPSVAETSADDAKPSSGVPDTQTTPQPPSPQALLNQWYKRYPQAFFTGHTKPLKVGIHQDLAQQEPWSGKLIRRALANYVNLPRYVKSMREGAERIDLDGKPAGNVDKEAARHASERRKDKQDSDAPKQTQSSENRKPQQAPKQAALKSPKKAAPTPVKPPVQVDREEATKKTETAKPLSLEDKLRGLQQKFTGR